jgi:hypothetical protein
MAKNGLVLITKTSFSGVSSVSLDNVFSATYSMYIIRRELSGVAAGSEIEMRLRASGSDATGANYRRQRLAADSTSVTGTRNTGVTYWPTTLGHTEATAIGFSETWISNPYEAVRTTAWTDSGYDATANITLRVECQAHDLASSYDGFTFYSDATTNMTGWIAVYGLVKS